MPHPVFLISLQIGCSYVGFIVVFGNQCKYFQNATQFSILYITQKQIHQFCYCLYWLTVLIWKKNYRLRITAKFPKMFLLHYCKQNTDLFVLWCYFEFLSIVKLQRFCENIDSALLPECDRNILLQNVNIKIIIHNCQQRASLHFNSSPLCKQEIW